MTLRFSSLDQFIADAPNAMAMFDLDMRYLAASALWLRDFGLGESPVGRSHYDVFPEINDALRAVHRRCLAGATEVAERGRFVRADGRVQWLRWEVRPWREADDAIGGVIVASLDITLQVEAHERAQALSQRLEESLKRAQEAERRLKDAIDVIPAGFDIFDADDRLVLSNAAAEAMYPHGAAQRKPGAPFEALLRIAVDRGLHGSTLSEREDWLRDRMERHRNPSGAFEQLTADGRWIRIEERRISNGGTAVIRTDVTDIENRRREVAQKNALLEAILGAMAEGIAVYDGSAALLIANETAAQLLDAPSALLDRGAALADLIRFRADRGDFGDVPPDETARLQDAAFFQRRRWTCTLRQRSGRVIETRFSSLADAGGVFLFRDVTERADYEARLARKTEELERVFENMGEGISLFGPDLRLVTRNEITDRILDLPAPLHAVGSSFADIVRFRAERGDFGEVDIESTVQSRIARFRAGLPWEETKRSADGLVYETRFSPTPDGGGVFVLRDVSERANSEAKLVRETARLQATLRNMGEGILVYDGDRRLLVVNDRVAELLDAPAALFEPGSLYDDLHRFRAERGDFGDLDPEVAVRDRVALFQDRKPWSRAQRERDGRVLEVRFNPTEDGGGVFVVLDVTRAAEREEKLARETALLEATFENMGEGVVVFDANRKLLVANEFATRLVDLPGRLVEPGASYDDLLRGLATTDPSFDGDVDAFVAPRVAAFCAQKPFVVVRGLKDGRIIETRFTPTPGGGGVFIYCDVTMRERAQAQIREEEAKFRSLVEQDVAGIVILREDGTIGYCNGCFASLLDLPPEELLGRPLLSFVPEPERTGIADKLHEQLFGTGDAAQIASSVRARDGTIREVLVNASRSTFEGRPASVAVIVDVSARNEAQRELASTAAVLAAVHEASPDGILVADRAGRVRSVNNRFGEMFGVPSELLARADARWLLARASAQVADPEAYRRWIQRLAAEPDARAHEEILVRDGRVIDQLTWPLTTASGKRLGRIWFLRDITERRKADERLRASEERFRMLVEEAPDAIMLFDPADNRCVAVNRAAERLFGVPRADLLERGPWRSYAAEQPVATPADETFAEHIRRAASGEQVSFERRIRRPSGEERLCEVTLLRLPSDDRLLRASFVDITERAEQAAKLAERTALLEATLENMGEGIAVYDADHRLQIANTAYLARLLEAPPELLQVGAALDDFGRFRAARGDYGDRTFESIVEAREAAFRAGETLSLTAKGPGGRTIDSRSNPMPGGGVVLLFRDVSERAGYIAQLTDALDRAERASKAKSEFLAMASHELRTPMNAIIGLSSALRDSKLPQQARRQAEVIETAGESLLIVINDLLEFASLDARRTTLDLTPIDVGAVAASAVEIARALPGAENLAFHVNVDPDLPSPLVADVGRIRRILVSLLDNAVKHTAAGTVTVRASAKRTDGAGATTLRLEVEDTGEGFPPDDAARLFEPFERGAVTDRVRPAGLGLGLATCRKLVELMGGTIAAASTPGVGSRFWIEAPVQAPAGRVRAEGGEASTTSQKRRSLKVLVAEDIAANRDVMRAMLKKLGHEAHFAEDGIEAVAAARKHAYDVILMDVQMPHMDGLEATRTLRKSGGRLAAVPIIAVTAYSQATDRDSAFAAGVSGFLAKPVRRTELDQALQAITVDAV